MATRPSGFDLGSDDEGIEVTADSSETKADRAKADFAEKNGLSSSGVGVASKS